MNNDLCIFFYHGCDFADPPGRQQYLMTALARHVPVVYLDGGVDKGWRVTFHEPQPNLTVVRGLIAVGERLDKRGITGVARAYAGWQLREFYRRHRRIIFWGAENWLRPYRFIRHDALVYDCIDPCFSDDPERIETFQSRDRLAMADAKLVFATADTLADFCRKHHRQVKLLNNACEPADYSPQLLESAPRPDWWPDTQKPIAAYLGSLDWRFDFAAIEKAIRTHTDLHFVLAGNPLPLLKERVGKLSDLPNVSCPGRISVSDGRYLVSRCAIGLIPFTTGAMNDAINPVKMYMYAQLGKPMAGTPVRELVKHPDIVATGGAAPGDFVQAVSDALAASRQPDTGPRLKAFAAENTWQMRADEAWQAISQL